MNDSSSAVSQLEKPTEADTTQSMHPKFEASQYPDNLDLSSRPSLDSNSQLLKMSALDSGTGTRGSSLDHPDHCVLSCPELGHIPNTSPGVSTPIGPHSPLPRRKVDSISQPHSPNWRRSRLALRFRRMRPWGSLPGSSRSTSSFPSSPHEDVVNDQVRFQTGKERRRRARESERRRKSSYEAETPKLSAEDGARPLVVAGVLLATSELDRLSSRARAKQDAVDKAGETC